ncbi:hypothetical protein Tco_0505028 [Tanacetum coccineum]
MHKKNVPYKGGSLAKGEYLSRNPWFEGKRNGLKKENGIEKDKAYQGSTHMSQGQSCVSREKEKGVELREVEDAERPRPTSQRSLLTLKPLPKIDPKDKGMEQN